MIRRSELRFGLFLLSLAVLQTGVSTLMRHRDASAHVPPHDDGYVCTACGPIPTGACPVKPPESPAREP